MPFEASSGMLAQHFSRAAVDPEQTVKQQPWKSPFNNLRAFYSPISNSFGGIYCL